MSEAAIGIFLMGVLCPYASLRTDVSKEAKQGYSTLFQKLNNGNGMQRYILIANIKMSLKTQLLCVFRLFLLGNRLIIYGYSAFYRLRMYAMPPYSFTDAAAVSGGNIFCSSCNSFTAVLQYPRESEVFFLFLVLFLCHGRISPYSEKSLCL